MKLFDEAHKALFKMANQLYTTIKSRRFKSEKEKIQNFLIQYTEEHFVEEEQLMRAHAFPGFEAHKRKHEDFKKEILHYKTRLDKGDQMDNVDFIKFIKDWIIDHILTEDRKYGPFLNDQGIF